ncbi:hypothetical protein ABMX48_36395 [Streptomyces cavourensis]
MVRLERFLTSLLASQPDPEQRKVLHQYAIWHLRVDYADAATAAP